MIYIKNRSDPKVDLWGAAALTSAHEENWPLKVPFTFWISESLSLNWGVYLKYHFALV